MLNERIPDLVLLDNVLPDENAPSICEYLASKERNRAVPVILLTATTDAGSLLGGLRAGAITYLTKPFDPKELLLMSERIAKLPVRQRDQQRSQMIATLSERRG